MESKKVLVVEDDEILRDGICAILRSEGHQPLSAENGMIAKKMLQETTFDLVVSDVQMPVLDGLQLLEIVKRDFKSRFLMMTEPSGALQTRHAFMLGADEFLNKPFTKAEFLKAVGTALTDDTPEEIAGKDYIPLPMDEFITGSTLKVDVHVRLPSGRFIKIGNRGGTLTQDRIQSYSEKGLSSFYIQKKDFASYVSFNVSVAQAVHGQPKIELRKKLKLTSHVTETIITQLCRSGLKREHLENASNVVLNAVELAMQNPATLKLLESMDTVGSLPTHSIAVSIWSCLIAKRLGWKGQSTFFKIALCALFHDVGQKEIDETLLNKPRFELTQSELKIVQNHTFRGRDILQSVPFMPEDVAIVAFQHHELMHGGGYPHGLKHDQIHPMARLIAVANAFYDTLFETMTDLEDIRLEAAYEQMSRNKRDYDADFLNKLGEVVQEAVKNKNNSNAA